MPSISYLWGQTTLRELVPASRCARHWPVVFAPGEDGAATDGIDNEVVQGVVKGVSILSATGAKNEAINVLTTSMKTSEKAESTVALSKSFYDMVMSFFNDNKSNQNE